MKWLCSRWRFLVLLTLLTATGCPENGEFEFGSRVLGTGRVSGTAQWADGRPYYGRVGDLCKDSIGNTASASASSTSAGLYDLTIELSVPTFGGNGPPVTKPPAFDMMCQMSIPAAGHGGVAAVAYRTLVFALPPAPPVAARADLKYSTYENSPWLAFFKVPGWDE